MNLSWLTAVRNRIPRGSAVGCGGDFVKQFLAGVDGEHWGKPSSARASA